MITSGAASATTDRDGVAPALPTAAFRALPALALASAHQRPVVAFALAAIAPGDLMGRREREQTRLALMDRSGSQHRRRLLCAGSDKPADHVITTRRAPKTTQSPADHTMRVPRCTGTRANYFQTGAGIVARKHRLARVAVTRGAFALLVFGDAAADGVIEAHELPAVQAAIEDWMSTTRATDAAEAIGLAMMRGIEDQAYFDELTTAYRTAVDELPPAA